MRRAMRVLVVGAGRMGSQIGTEYAIGGHPVTFLARDLAATERRVEQSLEVARGLGLATDDPDRAQGIRTTIAHKAPGNFDLIVESLPEDLALKVSILLPLVERQPNVAIATNTSSLSVGELGDEIGAPERTLGTHYWNPPLLMPLVEVIPGPHTRPDLVERVRGTLADLGKRPVVVAKDVPGFVWNRLQIAVMREALWLAEAGVVTPEEVDTIVREGLARRWRHVGPFEAASLGGADTWRRIGENLLPKLSDAHDLAGLERWLTVDEAVLGEARQRRDEWLSAELIDERRAWRAESEDRAERGFGHG